MLGDECEPFLMLPLTSGVRLVKGKKKESLTPPSWSELLFGPMHHYCGDCPYGQPKKPCGGERLTKCTFDVVGEVMIFNIVEHGTASLKVSWDCFTLRLCHIEY